MIAICKEAVETPDLLHDAPTTQIVARLDETAAVKNLDVRWRPGKHTVAPAADPKIGRSVAVGEGVEDAKVPTAR